MPSIMHWRRGLVVAIWAPGLRGVDVTITSSQTGGFSSESSPPLPRGGFDPDNKYQDRHYQGLSLRPPGQSHPCRDRHAILPTPSSTVSSITHPASTSTAKACASTAKGKNGRLDQRLWMSERQRAGRPLAPGDLKSESRARSDRNRRAN
jgi:hypothetical protein